MSMLSLVRGQKRRETSGGEEEKRGIGLDIPGESIAYRCLTEA